MFSEFWGTRDTIAEGSIMFYWSGASHVTECTQGFQKGRGERLCLFIVGHLQASHVFGPWVNKSWTASSLTACHSQAALGKQRWVRQRLILWTRQAFAFQLILNKMVKRDLRWGFPNLNCNFLFVPLEAWLEAEEQTEARTPEHTRGQPVPSPIPGAWSFLQPLALYSTCLRPCSCLESSSFWTSH